MNLNSQFEKENYENILIYHYVEELVRLFSEYSEENFNDSEITLSEMPFLLRIRFGSKNTQKDLVKLFHVSNGHASKILRSFEEKELIERKENPENRRIKLVKLTEKGIEKTDEIMDFIKKWEDENTSALSDDELKMLKRSLFKLLIKN